MFYCVLLSMLWIDLSDGLTMVMIIDFIERGRVPVFDQSGSQSLSLEQPNQMA